MFIKFFSFFPPSTFYSRLDWVRSPSNNGPDIELDVSLKLAKRNDGGEAVWAWKWPKWGQIYHTLNDNWMKSKDNSPNSPNSWYKINQISSFDDNQCTTKLHWFWNVDVSFHSDLVFLMVVSVINWCANCYKSEEKKTNTTINSVRNPHSQSTHAR